MQYPFVSTYTTEIHENLRSLYLLSRPKPFPILPPCHAIVYLYCKTVVLHHGENTFQQVSATEMATDSYHVVGN
jgi:hypothetical protein